MGLLRLKLGALAVTALAACTNSVRGNDTGKSAPTDNGSHDDDPDTMMPVSPREVTFPACTIAQKYPIVLARDHLDSWGVNTELSVESAELTAAKLNGVGIRHIRSPLVQGATSNIAAWQALESAMMSGGYAHPHVAFEDLVIAYLNDTATTWAVQKPAILAAAREGLLASVEGPNEMNNYGTGDGSHGVDTTEDATEAWGGDNGNIHAWAQTIHDWKASLTGDDAAALAKVAVVAPSIAVAPADQTATLPDLTGLVDYGNVHYYSGSGLQPSLLERQPNPDVGYFENVFKWTQDAMYPAHTFIMSEGGAATPPGDGYSLHAQAAYVLNQLHDAAGIGVKRWFIYTLFDPSTGSGGNEGNFGILQTDTGEKPAAIALASLKHIFSLANDYDNPANEADSEGFAAAYAGCGLDVTGIDVGTIPSRVSDAVVYPKSDGSTVISVTEEQRLSDGHGNDVTPTAVSATVHFGVSLHYRVYDIFQSTPLSPATEGTGESVELTLNGYPLYIVVAP